MNDILFENIETAATAIQTKQISPVELTKATLSTN